jgi:hypothetical protein
MIVIHRAVFLRSELRLASIATIGIACSSSFLYAHWNLGIGDPLTHLCSAIALVGNGPVTAISVLIGCMNDERAVLALPFIALWRCPKPECLRWRSGCTWSVLARAALPLVIGLMAALCARHALTVGWVGNGISKPSLYERIENAIFGFRPWLGSWRIWFINCLKGPGWFGIFLFTPFLSSRWRPGHVSSDILGVFFLIACISSLIVADVARSIGFAYPAMLLGCVWMYDRDSDRARKLALFLASLQVITPAIWIYQSWRWIQFRPFPWEFWLWIHS